MQWSPFIKISVSMEHTTVLLNDPWVILARHQLRQYLHNSPHATINMPATIHLLFICDTILLPSVQSAIVIRSVRHYSIFSKCSPTLCRVMLHQPILWLEMVLLFAVTKDYPWSIRYLTSLDYYTILCYPGSDGTSTNCQHKNAKLPIIQNSGTVI